MADEAERARERNRLAMRAIELDHGYRSLGRALGQLAAFLAGTGDGRYAYTKVGFAGLFAGWRDRRLALDRHFEELERDTIVNEE